VSLSLPPSAETLPPKAPVSTWSDLRSGFLVFLIALPLCLGIAMASGFPPIAGIFTAVIGGLLVTVFGSARLTIKGPAAGLIVVVLAAVQELGHGDPVLGYRRALAVGVVAAVIQILLGALRVATVGVTMSPSVVHGMLAAIGLIIISKQSHVALGVKATAKEPLALLLELPHSILHLNPEVATIGLGSLLILFLQPKLPLAWMKRIPAQAYTLLFAVPLGIYFGLDHAHDYQAFAQHYHVGPEYLVTLPSSLLSAVTFPDFSDMGSVVFVKCVVMFMLVGSIESVLSTLAVDALDPVKRSSNLNRDLFATGVGNLVAASIGGLPMISEIVRSKANIDAGAQSSKSNFFHGLFLAVAVAAFPALLHQIPLAALAAMLVFTGTRLFNVSELLHVKEIGKDQLALFLTTLTLTLATDLLVGVLCGLCLEVILHWWRGASIPTMLGTKVHAERDGSTLKLRIAGAAAFPAILQLRKHVTALAPDVSLVSVDLGGAVLVDHTFLARLDGMAQEWPHARLEIVGIDGLRSASLHPHATRRRA